MTEELEHERRARVRGDKPEATSSLTDEQQRKLERDIQRIMKAKYGVRHDG